MKVEFFDSLEEAQDRLREAMEAADGKVKPWQAVIGPGDCFIADGGEEGLLVFGEVLEGYQEAHLRHYRFCRCYSVACPEGELGDVHVSTVLCRVSRAFFDEMRQEGWQMEAGQRPRSSGRKTEEGGSAAGEARAGITSHRSSQGACGPRACPGGGRLPGPATASSSAATCRIPRSRSSALRRRRACRSPFPKGRAWRAGP